MPGSCDIIIPVWNAPDETAECIDSIIKNTKTAYRLIIIDNGSDLQARDYLDGLKRLTGLNVEIIRNEENLGFVKAVNQGMRASSAAYLCLMNNDTVAESGWLEHMIRAADADPKAGIVNPSSNTFGAAPAGEIQELYSARGFCMLIKREVIEKIGYFDEAFNIGYFEETDFSLRARKAGFEIIRIRSAYVRHKENVSFKKLKDNAAIFAGNEELFFKRWPRTLRIGYFPDPATDHAEVSSTALSAARSGDRVTIFMRKGSAWPVATDHINIRRVDLEPAFFALAAIYKTLKRRKKKKIDKIITDDAFMGRLFTSMKGLFKADVVIIPKT